MAEPVSLAKQEDAASNLTKIPVSRCDGWPGYQFNEEVRSLQSR